MKIAAQILSLSAVVLICDARGDADLYCGDRSCYQVLGLDEDSSGPGFDATAKDIKSAYRKLSLKVHPDRGGDEAEFIALAKANEILGDVDKRKDYDYYLQNPQDRLYNSMRYYHAVYKPKSDVRAVALGLFLAVSGIHYLLLWDGYRRRAKGVLQDPVVTRVWKKKNDGVEFGKQDAAKVLAELERQGLEGFVRPRLSDTLVYRLAVFPFRGPFYLRDAISRRREAAQNRAAQEVVEQAAAAEAQALERAKESAKMHRQEEKAALQRDKAKAQAKALQLEAEKRATQQAADLAKVGRRESVVADLVRSLEACGFEESLARILDQDIRSFSASPHVSTEEMEALVSLGEPAPFSTGVRRLGRKVKERRQHELDKLSSSSSRGGSTAAAAKGGWSEQEIALLNKAAVKFPPGSRNRWWSVANYMGSAGVSPHARTEQECAKMAAEIKQKTFAKGAASSSSSSSSSSAASNNQAKSAPDSEQWTEKEQRLLEDGLKKFGALPDPKEKWRSIAAAIPGRSAKDCLLRFQKIRSALLSNKQQQ